MIEGNNIQQGEIRANNRKIKEAQENITHKLDQVEKWKIQINKIEKTVEETRCSVGRVKCLEGEEQQIYNTKWVDIVKKVVVE